LKANWEMEDDKLSSRITKLNAELDDKLFRLNLFYGPRHVAMVGLLLEKGVFTAEDWDKKVAELELQEDME